MKKEITLGNLLGILVPLFVLILGWGISVNTRLANNTASSDTNSKNIDKIEEDVNNNSQKIDENFKIIIEKLDKILYNEIKKKD